MLLPLSGPSGTIGRAMLDAAQMALFDVGDESLQLLPRDTQGQPEAAAAAAQAVIGEGARIIVGPLLAAEVEAVKPVARAANVPVLAFSTAAPLAGDGTYLMGFLPRQEIERVVSFAHAKGRGRFGVLAPRTPYGEIAVEALRGATTSSGANLGPVEYYDATTTDLTPVVRRFAASVGDTDALLLPEGGNRLKALAPLLPYFDVDPTRVKFLGTGLWDEPGLGTEPALDGGWYAAPPPAARADFERRFATLYRHPPPRLATLGYDATALAAVLARNPAGPDFSAQALTNPSGFAGIDGIFRLRPDGLVQRGLAVLEVHRGAPAVVDPAPDSFQELGY
jgi:ABC-type branched-subunit amino acid transport system substrate-binding protein